MQIEKRGVVVQTTLFIIFFFLGIFTFLQGVIGGFPSWLNILRIVSFAIVVASGVAWLLLTKKESFLVIDKKYATAINISLWIMFVALLLSIINMYFLKEKAADYFYIISGSIMTVTSLFGTLVSLKVYFSKNAGND